MNSFNFENPFNKEYLEKKNLIECKTNELKKYLYDKERYNNFNEKEEQKKYQNLLKNIDLLKRARENISEELKEAIQYNKDLDSSKNSLKEKIDSYREKKKAADDKMNLLMKIVFPDDYGQGLKESKIYTRLLEESIEELYNVNNQQYFDVSQIENGLKKLDIDIERLDQQQKEVKKNISCYQSIDIQKIDRVIVRLETKIEEIQEEFKDISEKKHRFDNYIQPIIDEMKIAVEDKNKAKELQERLSYKNNSKYDKAMIHKECEQIFGESNPSKVIGDRERLIVSLQRKLDKRVGGLSSEIDEKNRREEILQNMEILLIDGNNLCYRNGSDFVGLSPLIAITRYISEKFDVKINIVFDPYVEELLKMERQEIEKYFVDDIIVDILQSGRKADKQLLDYAEGKDCCYILSNDNYSEYFGREVIENKRIIKHDITTEIINIEELGIKNLKY